MRDSNSYRTQNYEQLLNSVFHPIVDQVENKSEQEVKEYFYVVLGAAEQSLRALMRVKVPKPEFDFRKQLTESDMDFWLRRVTLAVIAYSYYFYTDVPQIEYGQAPHSLSGFSYDLYWQRMYDLYNQIFNEHIEQRDINHYASGLREDNDKGYSRTGDFQKAAELSNFDAVTIASELMEQIWRERLPNNAVDLANDYYHCADKESFDVRIKRALFIGINIWQTYRQLVQPFLLKLLESNKQ